MQRVFAHAYNIALLRCQLTIVSGHIFFIRLQFKRQKILLTVVQSMSSLPFFSSISGQANHVLPAFQQCFNVISNFKNETDSYILTIMIFYVLVVAAKEGMESLQNASKYMLSVYCKILLQLSNISLINNLGYLLDIDYFILNRRKILGLDSFF